MIAARLLQFLPPETAHRVAVRALGFMPPGIPAKNKKPKNKKLSLTVAGLRFANPVGLAAGFDKNAQAMGGAFGLGFGHVETGTITPRPQAGNARPRVFRLPEDGAVINRYGFNNDGMEVVAERLRKFRVGKKSGVLGVNIGANKDSKNPVDDYNAAAAMLTPFADYMVVNISSPNTPGLRGLQAPDLLAEVIAAAREGMKKSPRPLFVKLSPDLDKKSLKAAVQVAVRRKCAGLIIANTSTHRPEWLKGRHGGEAGGLSGAPLLEPSTRMLMYCRRYLVPKGFPLIGVGGVRDAESAYMKIRAGASLVQMYTALALGRAQPIPLMLADMEQLLKRDGFRDLQQAIAAGPLRESQAAPVLWRKA